MDQTIYEPVGIEAPFSLMRFGVLKREHGSVWPLTSRDVSTAFGWISTHFDWLVRLRS
jgi:hypothetical protein